MIGRGGFITGVVAVGMMVGLFAIRPNVRLSSMDDPAFVLPIQYFGCLEIQLQTGERFGNWRLQQPTKLILHEGNNVFVHQTIFESVCPFDYAIDVSKAAAAIEGGR